MSRVLVFSGLLLIAVPATSWGNPLEEAVKRTGTGTVECTYNARAGVFGNGDWIVTPNHGWRGGSARGNDCESGPVRLTLRVRDGKVTDLDTSIGRKAREQGTDLGLLPVAEVEAFLFDLAATGDEDIAEDAVFALTLADDPAIWNRLLDFTRDTRIPVRARGRALFWLAGYDEPEVTAYFEALILD